MNPELIGILAVGVTMIGVMVSLFAWTRADIGQLRREVAGVNERVGHLEERVGRLEERLGRLETDLGERMARVEGMIEVLIQAIGIKRPEAAE